MISRDPELPKKKAEALFWTLLASDVHVLNLPNFTDNSLVQSDLLQLDLPEGRISAVVTAFGSV